MPSTVWWSSRKNAKPAFRDPSPYHRYLVDRTSLLALYVPAKQVYVDGELRPLGGGDFERKMDVLRLLEDACIWYWTMPPSVRRLRSPSIAYAVTVSFVRGLWKDLLYEGTTIQTITDWQQSGDGRRRRFFRLAFPSRYTGAICAYVVRDCRFLDHGVSYTARTVEPWFE